MTSLTPWTSCAHPTAVNLLIVLLEAIMAMSPLRPRDSYPLPSAMENLEANSTSLMESNSCFVIDYLFFLTDPVLARVTFFSLKCSSFSMLTMIFSSLANFLRLAPLRFLSRTLRMHFSPSE